MLSCRQKAVESQNWQWRGENRNGMYLSEIGLLKEWSPDGPELLWYFQGLGDGYTSAAIANGRIYITGVDEDDNLSLFVLDLNGRLIDSKEIGQERSHSYPGPRSSVNVNDGRLYIFNSLGILVCLDEATLAKVWSRDLIAEFEGRNKNHGITENPLIVGDKIFMTPGGETHNVIALNKHTGELIWSSSGRGRESVYGSPIFIDGYSIPILIAFTQQIIIAFNADTGEVLWSHPIHMWDVPNTALYYNGMIYTNAGAVGWSTMLRLTDSGRAVELVWENQDIGNRIGAAVKVGDYIYLGGDRNRGFFCLNWNTGELMYRSTDIANGAIIYADGMLYYYSDRGEVALIRPNPEKLDLVSSFMITQGTGQHWAHPVIHNGVLYIRRGDALMAYKVKN